MVRCFVGIMLPEEVKDRIVDLQKQIMAAGVEGKTVERENMHISLSFLGEVQDIEEIKQKAGASLAGTKKFHVIIRNVLLIPNEKFIRVIAIDAADEKGLLENLRRTVKQNIGGESYPAHVTLCRVRNIKDRKQFVDRIKNLSNSVAGEFEVSGVQLIKSELSREGPAYTVVENFPLE